jgi:drug/metabolite transporter (DMT)-like permease
VALLLAVAGALCNALTTIFQRMGVQSAPEGSDLRLRLIWHILHRPVWFIGFATMIGGFALQAAALGVGDLSLVQPVMVSELVFLVVILRVVFKRHLGWQEAAGTSGTVLGLAVFLAVSDQGGGNDLPSTGGWGLLVGCVLGAIVVSVLMTRRGGRVWRSAWFGAGAALAFALCAAFTKTATILFAGGFLHLFAHWETYGIAGAGLIGLFLAQNAFYAGPITASQASLTIIDPLVSIAIGASVFGDRLRDGRVDLGVEAVALVVMVAGLVLLCNSPLIVDAIRQERLEAGGGPAAEPQVGEVGTEGELPTAGSRSPLPSA